MYILYMDESGTEELGAEPKHFVLLGLAIRSEFWKKQDALIESIKARYGLQGVEIHTAWMMRRYSEQERLMGFAARTREERRTLAEQEVARQGGVLGVKGDRKKSKYYRTRIRKIRAYLHLTHEERKRCLLDLAQQIGEWGAVRIFGEAIQKDAFLTQRMSPYEQAFEQVLTRYQAFLARVDDTGIVVHDRNSKVAPRLMRLTRKFHDTGTLFRQIGNIVETPLFVDSELTSMIQMADLAAYALRRFIEKGEADLWQAIRPRVDQVNGVHVGVRHFTGKQWCDCQVCIEHGRKGSDNVIDS